MRRIFILFLLFILSCDNTDNDSTPEPEPEPECTVEVEFDDLYAFLKPNGIEMQNDYCSRIYYVLTKSEITDLDSIHVGQSISSFLEPAELRVISHENYTAGQERYLYWWTDDYENLTDLFVTTLHLTSKNK
jgi:hypothetical protein